MSAQVSESSITYLRDELGLTVDRVQQSLEVYSEDPESVGELTQAGDYLKQMAGVLTMLDAVEGASFARELAELVDRLSSGEIDDSQTALQVLLQESLKLEPFLDGLRRGSCPVEKPDLARAIDRVRDMLGKPLLNLHDRGEGSVDADAMDRILIRQLRSGYQHALACVFRKKEIPEHLSELERVLAQLADTCHTRDGYWLWWLCGRLIHLLQEDQLQISPPVLRLLGGVDRQIKNLLDNGEQAYSDPGAKKLSADIEATIRTVEVGQNLLAERQHFNPPKAAATNAAQSHVLPDVDTLKEVATNLADDISVLQHAVDQVARGASLQQIDIGDVVNRLHTVAAVLSMLNMASSANLLQQQYQRVRDQSELDASALDRLVADLVLVEASLSALMDPALSASGVCDETNFDDPEAQLQAIKHLQARMAATEQAIEDVEKVLEMTRQLHAGTEEPLWEPMPQLLHRVANVFSILGHQQACEVTERLREIVSDADKFNRIKSNSEYMPALAESMVAIEYFLKAEYGLEARNPRYLNHAESCLARLEASLTSDEQDTAELNLVHAEETPQSDVGADHVAGDESATEAQHESEQGAEEASTEALGTGSDEEPNAAPVTDQSQSEKEPAEAANNDAPEQDDDDLLTALEAITTDSEAGEPATLAATTSETGDEPVTADTQGVVEVHLPQAEASDEPVASEADSAIEGPAPEADTVEAPIAFEAGDVVELPAPEADANDEAAESAADAAIEAPATAEEIIETPAASAAQDVVELSVSGEETSDELEALELEASLELSASAAETLDLDLDDESSVSLGGDDDVVATPGGSEQPEWVNHEFLDIFLEEAVGEVAQLRELVPAWCEDMGRQEELTAIRRSFHTLKGSGRMVGAEKAGEFAWKAEDLLNRVLDGRIEPNPALGELMAEVVGVYGELIEHMHKGREDVALTQVETGLLEFLNGPAESQDSEDQLPSEARVEDEVDAQAAEEDSQQSVDETVAEHQEVDPESASEHPEAVAAVAPEPEPESEPEPKATATSTEQAELDPELVEIFSQEGADILDSSDVILDRWTREPDNLDLLADLRREMHTLKGSSRMAGFLVIGDLAHAFEFVLDAISKGESQFSPAVGDKLQRTLDRLHLMLAVAQKMEQPDSADDLIALLSQGDGDESDAESAGSGEQGAAGASSSQPQPVPEPARSAAADAVMLVPDASDMVRVSVDLLDKLADQMGESSIYRARISQNVSRFDVQLKEMDHTITRLSEKLRRLEIETEAQILFRYESKSEGDFEEFDPLELDRFSELQQLSRSLMEVVSDLNSIRGTLDEQSQGLDTLLHQQAKVNHEIQEALTRTRMVRFDSIVPRMRRVVRQAADELGKRADLVLEGSAEMERGLLEHIVGPLEHILRNAVSHGIEEPANRSERDKPETGSIVLNMRREGSELVLDISDDGAGINFDAVRRKAEKAGFLQAGQPSTKDQLVEVLLMPGFSTADRLTQVSGRGVGMDVVNDAVRGLGGSLSIDSERGKGAKFTLRLPFSLSVTKALLVQAGGETFAVPLAGIEAMTRIASEDLRSYAEHGSGHLVYGDNHYEIHSLGALLGGTAPQGDDLDRQLPAMLVKSEGLNVAFQIDAVLGSEETIVKPAGPQVNSVPGLAGATILGDGRVVLLLEMAALVRNFVTRAAQIEAEALQRARTESEDSKLRVMVVDDSITMRKVTSRLLERQGVQPLLAKDGLDAAGQLEDIVPDALVLDIEMPRMDGYELASHIRNQEHLWHLPIIMVTSRSGDKHRLRAMDLGVNAYLGKPYREEELVVALQRVLGDKASRLAIA